jgi:hypothetical protein
MRKGLRYSEWFYAVEVILFGRHLILNRQKYCAPLLMNQRLYQSY